MTDPPRIPIEIEDPFARQLLTRYIERRKADFSRLRAALEAEDFDTIRRTGHNLFGSGDAYGLSRITVLGGELEQAATLRERERTGRLIDELEQYVRSIAVA